MSFSSISRYRYDVFLSFKGEDAHKNFTDHLYDTLKRNGIITFRVEPRLEGGERIACHGIELKATIMFKFLLIYVYFCFSLNYCKTQRLV